MPSARLHLLSLLQDDGNVTEEEHAVFIKGVKPETTVFVLENYFEALTGLSTIEGKVLLDRDKQTALIFFQGKPGELENINGK